MAHGRGGANGFMRTLRVFFVFVSIRALRQVSRTVFLAHVFTHFLYCFRRDADRVGTHISDETNRTFFAEFDAFVQALRDHHRALHAETQFARRVLLQLAGGKGRRGVAAALFFVDSANDPVGGFEGAPNFFSVCGVVDFNLLFALADEAGVESGRLAGGEVRIDGPVFDLLERLDFAFTFDNQAKRDGLDASGGNAAPDFVPEERGNLIADEPVEHTAGLLGVDQILIDGAG